MCVEDNANPKFGLNHPFNTGLGIPIARQYGATLSVGFGTPKTNSHSLAKNLPTRPQNHRCF